MIIDYLYLLIIFIILFSIFYKLSFQIKLLDHPSSRKIHDKPIPLIGGILIYSTILISSFFFDYDYKYKLIIYVSAIILIVGIIDDRFNISPYLRLLFQFTGTIILIQSGLVILSLGYYEFIGEINLFFLSYIITAISVVVLLNAFNFIDGVDGLCSSTYITSNILIIIFINYFNNFNIDLVFFLNICFITFLFLIFNFSNYGKIFLGDAGSTFIGFLLSWILIYITSDKLNYMHQVMALWVICYPVYEFFSVLLCRIVLRKKNPLISGKDHLHFLLLNNIHSHLIVTFIICALYFLIGILGLISFVLFGSLISLCIYIFLFIIYFAIYIQFVNQSLK